MCVCVCRCCVGVVCCVLCVLCVVCCVLCVVCVCCVVCGVCCVAVSLDQRGGGRGGGREEEVGNPELQVGLIPAAMPGRCCSEMPPGSPERRRRIQPADGPQHRRGSGC